MNRLTCVVVAGLGVAAPAFAQAPLGTVQGRVLGPDGEPTVNIEVTARPGWRGGAVLAKARTDGDGMFVLAHVPADRGVHAKRAADGKGRCEPFEVAPGATAEVEVRVAR